MATTESVLLTVARAEADGPLDKWNWTELLDEPNVRAWRIDAGEPNELIYRAVYEALESGDWSSARVLGTVFDAVEAVERARSEELQDDEGGD